MLGRGDSMDLMIGTIDAKRLRRDLLQMYRSERNVKSPVTKNAIYSVEVAGQEELVAIAKKEGISLRKYIR